MLLKDGWHCFLLTGQLEKGSMIRYINGKHFLMIFRDSATLLAALETKRKRKLRAEQTLLGLLLETRKKIIL